ncbi:MAG: hypothetical protein ACI4W2_12275 [Eubacterium sp.]
MKRSYKLLSMYLDHADMPSNPPDIGVAKDSKDCVDLTEGTTIFDYPVCIRRASGRELLRTNVFEKIQEEIDKLLVCDVIIIDLDYKNRAEIANRLFVKRILQIMELIRINKEKIKVTLVASEKDVPYYRKIIRDLYKEKERAHSSAMI